MAALCHQIVNDFDAKESARYGQLFVVTELVVSGLGVPEILFHRRRQRSSDVWRCVFVSSGFFWDELIIFTKHLPLTILGTNFSKKKLL